MISCHFLKMLKCWCRFGHFILILQTCVAPLRLFNPVADSNTGTLGDQARKPWEEPRPRPGVADLIHVKVHASNILKGLCTNLYVRETISLESIIQTPIKRYHIGPPKSDTYIWSSTFVPIGLEAQKLASACGCVFYIIEIEIPPVLAAG